MGFDWSIFFGTFITIFIAEMGDKTQFAAIAASAQSKSTWTVLAASILALSLAAIIGVLVGRLLNQYISPERMRIISGCLFIAMGVFTLLRSQTH